MEGKSETNHRNRLVCEAAVAATEKTIERIMMELFSTVGSRIERFVRLFDILPGYRMEFSVGEHIPVVYYKDESIDIHSLSGSEKALMYIGMKMAVSLALENELFVLDDPMLYLDGKRQKQFMNTMMSMARAGKQIILTTTHPDLVPEGASVITL